MPQTTTLLATALAMVDEDLGDDQIVDALLADAGEEPAELASAHAGAVFLADRDPQDTNAHRVSELLARALRLAVQRRWSSGRL